MRFGRWLLAVSDLAQVRLDDCYESWARALVGSPAWRSGIIAAGELGWQHGGFLRGVVDVAKRRAKLWSRDCTDFHRRIFEEAHNEGTWASRSLALLKRWNLLDWPQWREQQYLHAAHIGGYVKYVKLTLAKVQRVVWSGAALKHRCPVPYSRIMTGMSVAPLVALSMNMEWSALLLQLSHARLRCGTVSLGHLSGRKSSARVQQCQCCNLMVSNL